MTNHDQLRLLDTFQDSITLRFATRQARIASRNLSLITAAGDDDAVPVYEDEDSTDAAIVHDFMARHMMMRYISIRIVLEARMLCEHADHNKARVLATQEMAREGLLEGGSVADTLCVTVCDLATKALKNSEGKLHHSRTIMIRAVPAMLLSIAKIKARRPSLTGVTDALHECLTTFQTQAPDVPTSLGDAFANMNHAINLFNAL